jgi:hypothetical protein
MAVAHRDLGNEIIQSPEKAGKGLSYALILELATALNGAELWAIGSIEGAS